ncbi:MULTISPECIES: SRPBCC family protein [Ralstonia]|uniref:SRPBCC family protein n=1 Tax=Ralstonia mojiangensis TaxID=2953895 RepID=A0AAE3HZW8_9RALS|nr:MULTISPECIES: SRPBCC family protein [Ralstonia]MCO5412110.1 SRPBCC family protein [Ralstonia mojiangensis]MCT7296515.1 SRPBCC family protein [Ralstonia mojiangensis]MCT7310930.1 SRPBCC family protein [Ralstonia mojiangensis]MCT7315054.1 SRPBCC family protein [Ralstonia mojiangensis]MCT7326087.1 SRPBCC family protein [Ralstonia mojiangensis]
MLHNVRTLSINVERHFDDVAMFLAEPLNFPIWATGLSEGLAPGTQGSGAAPDEWIAKAAPNSDEGCVFIRFSPPNEFGIADHWVRLPDGSIVYVPLRVVRNGAGTTVSLTLFQQPNMDDAQFEADAEWVQRDLVKLKTVLEAE